MGIVEILWTDEDIEHIARHGVTPEEVEEVLDSRPLWLKGRRHPETGLMILNAFGRTEAGRYLFVVFSPRGRGRGRCITAREMDSRSRRLYHRHRR